MEVVVVVVEEDVSAAEARPVAARTRARLRPAQWRVIFMVLGFLLGGEPGRDFWLRRNLGIKKPSIFRRGGDEGWTAA